MRNNWIKVSEALPKLQYISDNWSCSSLCLCTDGEEAFTAYFQQIDEATFWDGYRRYTDITHWQPLELPE